MRRHPEIKLRRSAEDVDRLARLQAKLLSAVQSYVKPGGLLVYAVCTLTSEECDEQVDRFTNSHSQFRIDPPPAGFPADCLQGTLMRTLPHRTGTDGFFAVRLRRT
jgi:16S rRNA (cytosine967-C5)-methyltransferase